MLKSRISKTEIICCVDVIIYGAITKYKKSQWFKKIQLITRPRNLNNSKALHLYWVYAYLEHT